MAESVLLTRNYRYLSEFFAIMKGLERIMVVESVLLTRNEILIRTLRLKHWWKKSYIWSSRTVCCGAPHVLMVVEVVPLTRKQNSATLNFLLADMKGVECMIMVLVPFVSKVQCTG